MNALNTLLIRELNRALDPYGKKIGPDPTSELFATTGGMVANNSSGEHYLRHGNLTRAVQGLEAMLADGTRVRVRRRFDPVTGISHERLQWKRGDATGSKSHALRLRTATEIDRLLVEAGFGPVEYCGDWNGSELERRSPRLIAVAHKS